MDPNRLSWAKKPMAGRRETDPNHLNWAKNPMAGRRKTETSRFNADLRARLLSRLRCVCLCRDRFDDVA